MRENKRSKIRQNDGEAEGSQRGLKREEFKMETEWKKDDVYQ